MEAHRLELEEEISRLKSNNLVDKLNAEEQLQSAKQRIKAEEVRERQESKSTAALPRLLETIVISVLFWGFCLFLL